MLLIIGLVVLYIVCGVITSGLMYHFFPLSYFDDSELLLFATVWPAAVFGIVVFGTGWLLLKVIKKVGGA